MLDVFRHGEDMHSTVAYMIFPEEIPRDTPIKDIKKNFKHLRQIAKGPEFCFAYGGNDSTLMQQYGMDEKQAKSIYENYMSGFCGIKDFQASQKEFVVQHGYILITPVTGHKSWWWDYTHWQRVQKSFNRDFWEEYRRFHKGTGDAIAQKVGRHFKAKTKYEKNACNSPMQGAGAALFKVFNRRLFKWILDNDLFGKVRFCIPVHDEIVLETPEELTDKVVAACKYFMEDSATPFCTKIPMPADAEIGDYWIH